ncbi:hypothetical protein GBF38_000117 [Nibea albiflora]|nr:hypothetical protein GBF38_000117 [Nibea albiflora]
MFPLFSLVALSIVEIQPVNIDGKVGKSVKFKCSGWNVWKNVEEEDKFFCNSQCSDVIVTAAFGKTERKDRIEITNRKDGLHVTFMNAQKSDSQKYYCGVKGLIFYDYIEVNLKVTDAESTRPSPTPKTLPVTTTEFITDTSTSHIIDFTETIAATSTKTAGMNLTGPDGAQQSLHPLMADEDQFYSTLQPINRNAVLESMSVDTRSGS